MLVANMIQAVELEARVTRKGVHALDTSTMSKLAFGLVYTLIDI
jgi:hypothetical protein